MGGLSQAGLEFGEAHIEGCMQSEGSSDGGQEDVTCQSVQVSTGWALHIEVSMADVIDGVVVGHEGTIRLLRGGVGAEGGVVGLNHSCGNPGGWGQDKWR